jgi:hypothetical protein
MGAASQTPAQTRAQETLFVSQCNLASLQKCLPLAWPTPAGTPASPKKRYRSEYVYAWRAQLQDLNQLLAWKDLEDFDLVLRLVDFSGLRAVLAQLLGWRSGRGWEPFDPISFFLLIGWQITHSWSRSQALKNLGDGRYTDYRRGFGFQPGVYPTEGGVRYFLTRLGRHSESDDQTVAVQQGEEVIHIALQKLNQLLVQAAGVLRQAQVLSPQAWQAGLLCSDGQIHDASSKVRCISATESCYQPTTPEKPRACPAKDKERRGCDCQGLECAQICHQATPRDQEARYVWYSGSNQAKDNPNRSTCPEACQAEHGQGRYGYRSLPLRLADPLRRCSLTLLDDVRPANEHEAVPSAALLLQLKSNYPDLGVDSVAGDAGLGFDVFLHTVYSLQARRVIDLRQHETDQDKSQWPLRGYDDRGRPVCPYGYVFHSFGWDRLRQRHKWACEQVCGKGKEPQVKLPHVTYPPAECPYQSAEQPLGRVINVAERFSDASIRLVRDLPVGSPAWKALYHRARNAVEGRNATMEGWGLKRLPVYGLPRSKAWLFLADTWETLTTLARLVREATQASLPT